MLLGPVKELVNIEEQTVRKALERLSIQEQTDRNGQQEVRATRASANRFEKSATLETDRGKHKWHEEAARKSVESRGNSERGESKLGG